jgi:hypothetical protein
MSDTTYLTHNGLLNYAVTTDPDPLQVSPAPDDPSMGSLTISVSANQNVYVKQIVFSFDVGGGVNDLTDVAAGILCSASPYQTWQITSENNGDQAVFIATLINGGATEFSGTGPTFTIYDIQVSEEVGTAVLNITETSSTTNSNYQDRTTQIAIPKTPAHFYVRDFATQTKNLQAGNSATLSWEGTQDDNTRYTIYWLGYSQNVTGSRSWITPAIQQTTTFILEVDRQYQGETFRKYLSCTVSVQNPSIVASELTVNDQINTQNIVINNQLTTHNLSMNGEFDLNAGHISMKNINSTEVGALDVAPGPYYFGRLRLRDLNGYTNVYLTANNSTLGEIDVCDNYGSTRAKLYVDNSTGTANGYLYLYNSNDEEAVQLYVDADLNGKLVVKDNSGYGNDIAMGVDDTNHRSIIKLGSSTYIASDGTLSAKLKNFVMPNPSQPETEIWYACVEGPEAAAYWRGTAQLINGQAFVELPQHFTDIACDQLTTILLTPLSADSLGLAVVEKSTKQFRVRELHKGTGTYAFDWEIKSVRKGMENYQVIRPKTT